MTMGATPDAPRPSELSEGSGNDRKRIDYFYDALIGNFNYGEGHPMRPHRVRLTHNLVVRYGLFQHLNIFRPKPASKAILNAALNQPKAKRVPSVQVGSSWADM